MCFNRRKKPVEFKIEGNSSPIKKIICVSNNTFAICQNKKVYYWGENNGELGLGDLNERITPVEFSDGKEEWEFFEEKTNNKLEWKEIKFLFIAFYKEDKKTCLLANLPKDMIKEISI